MANPNLKAKIRGYQKSPRVRGDFPPSDYKFHSAEFADGAVHLLYESTFWDGGEVNEQPYRFRQKCYTPAYLRRDGKVDLGNVGNTCFADDLRARAEKLFR